MSTSIDLTKIPEKGGTLDLPDMPPPSSTVPPTPVENMSGLEALRADLAVELTEEVTFPVPTRPGYQIVAVVDVSSDELDAWRKVAKSKRHIDGIDGIKLASLVVANKTVAIVRQGEPLVDGYGERVHFRHKDFLALVRATPSEQLTAAEAVRRFFGRDGAIDSVSKAILEQSGWGEDVAPDPTGADS